MSGAGAGGIPPRRSISLTRRNSSATRPPAAAAAGAARRNSTSLSSETVLFERTVKRLHLCKALIMPENTTVQEACQRMVARRVDAVLLTDSNGLLCGILTDKDIATRVIARELKLEETVVSKVMTRNPVFVLSDTPAVEAMQKMVHGNFRHLPVVDHGSVIALLDIAKCLYDAIARMERVAEKGNAIAVAVEGVEKHWRTSLSGPNTLIDSLREQMFKPSLSTMISEYSILVTVSPTDSVLSATQKMLENKTSSVVVTVENKPLGILTSRDILMRVIAPHLSPETTLVEKIMTPNPECGTVDTPIIEALHTMHNGKFLHLPIVDRDGNVVAVVDVIQITRAAVATVGSSTVVPIEATNTMMQKFWDSAMAVGPQDDDADTHSERSFIPASEATDIGRSEIYQYPGSTTTFGFKIQDKLGRMHRFNCDTQRLTDLMTSILQRVGDDIDRNRLPQVLYEDEDHDKVVLASDSDLAAAVDHARQAGWKSLKLHLEYPVSVGSRNGGFEGLEHAQRDAWASAYSTVAAGAALVVGLGVMAYLRRAGSS